MPAIRTYLTIIWGLWLPALMAQTPACLHYTVRDGLPGNLVYCGLQDKRGLLWFGTDKGLACFDGARFRTYGVSDGLPDPEVLHMQEDSKGRLWLFCFSQKPCYEFQGRIVTEREDPELKKIGYNTAGVTITEEKESGAVWFTGYSPDLYCLDGDSIQHFKSAASIASLVDVGNRLIAAGTTHVYSDYSAGLQSTLCEVNPNPNIFPIVGFGVSGNRMLYIFTNQLVLLEWRNGRMEVLDKCQGPSGKVYVDSRGRFWVSSTALGAVCYDNPNRDLSNPVRFLPDEKVTSVFEDKQGTFWFGTASNGVLALPQNAAVSYISDVGAVSRNIRSVARTATGAIIAGDDIGNLHAVVGNSVKKIPFGASDGYNLIRQIIADSSGTRLYIAMDEGAYVYDLEGAQKKRLIKAQNVKSICLDRDRLWYGTHGQIGLVQLPGFEDSVILKRRHTAIGIDAEHDIWAGGISGFYSQRDKFDYNWGEQFPELKTRITGIRTANKDKIWVVSASYGLLSVQVHDGRVEAVDVINKQLKKPIENIQSMFLEPGGRIWLATNRGVYGLSQNGDIQHFDTHHGLADDDVNAVLVYRDTLWAGTVSGLTRILLRSSEEKGDFKTLLVALQYQEGQKITRMHLLDSLPEHLPVSLPAGMSNLELDMAGLDFLARDNLKYEVIQTQVFPALFCLTFDNLWSWIGSGFRGKADTTLVESATYNLGPYLPSGRYRIQITAIKVSGTQSLYPDEWTIVRNPVWYELLWFWLLLWCALAYGAWRIYRTRAAYREVQNAASILQLQALQSQMNPHFIGNTVNAIQQFLHPPDPEKSSEYIAIFMRLLRRTMDFSEQAFIPFEEEFTYDQEYLQLVQLRFANKFRYEILGANEVPPAMLIPSMLLQPLLENATIHGIAPEGTSILKLEFFYTPRQLCCVVTDNGIGLNASQQQKQLYGIERKSKGLSLLYKKVNTLNRLYDLDLKLEVQDLSDLQPGKTGTRAVITYDPQKIWKTIKNHPPSATASAA